MPHEIYNWSDISSEHSGSILLGNGASISIDSCFAYTSIREHAIENGLLTVQVQRLFKYFQTSDFELILRLVWQANSVNVALDITDHVTKDAYEHVRDCLIKTVRSIHPEYSIVEQQFQNISKFLRSFNTILSLNYDLTLYWIIMYSNRERNGHYFKDCMINNQFDSEWFKFRKSIGYHDRRVTLVFYPHGSLALARNIINEEFKLQARSGKDLLCSILDSWKSGNFIPLFVSEGTSNQKLAAIQSSPYLNTVYSEVIPEIGDNLTIFGWGIGEHDVHILKRIKQSGVRRVAVSVYGNDQAYCNRVSQMIYDNIRPNIEILFFNCQSSGCWNQPVEL